MLIALVRTAVFWAVCSSLADAACDSPTILSPTTASTLAESRPVIRWSPVPKAERYRVRLRSQIPNGEILHDIDAIVFGIEFTPAVALADRLASVRVVVSPDCAPAFLDRG